MLGLTPADGMQWQTCPQENECALSTGHLAHFLPYLLIQETGETLSSVLSPGLAVAVSQG